MRQIIIDFGRLHLFNIDLTLRVYGYGLMLVLGFLCGIYLARWRARRMGEHPDAITYVGLMALIGGVVGARLAYVIQKWDEFANQPNPLVSMMDITSGGLIYYGGLGMGLVFVLVYMWAKRLPIRRYLDIIAPSIMIGLAFGRMGCLLNGCCFGGACDANWPLAAHFPMYSQPLVKLDGTPGPFSNGTDSPSPPYEYQFSTRQVQPDERLTIQVSDASYGYPLHAPRYLHGRLTNDQLTVMQGSKEEARKEFEKIAPEGRLTYNSWERARAAGNGLLRGSEFWDEAITFSQHRSIEGQPVLTFDDVWQYLQARREWLVKKFDTAKTGQLAGAQAAAANEYLQADLQAVASAEHANALRPSQALGAVNAMLLAGLLMFFYRLRTREGQVFVLMLVLYPITRFVEELIRADNPHNLAQFQLTHNQYTSMVMLLAGIVMWLLLRKLPPSAGPTWDQRAAEVRVQKSE